MIEVTRADSLVSPEVWSICEPWIAEALDVAGAWRTQDVYEWLENGDWTFWLVTRDGQPTACATSELGVFPRLRVVHLSLVAGRDIDVWLEPLFGAVEAHARDLGCDRLMCSYARRGWIPTLKPLGWTPRATVIAKDL